MGSLGHPSDDESGLIYMRARYVDPQIGRFVSEDTTKDGINFYSYCDNDPINGTDVDGNKHAKVNFNAFDLGFILAIAAMGFVFLAAMSNNMIVFGMAVAFAISAAMAFTAAFLGAGDTYKVASAGLTFGAAISEKLVEPTFKRLITGLMKGFTEAERKDPGMMSGALYKMCAYTLAQVGALAATEIIP